MKIVIDIPNSLYANLKKIQNGSIACKRILELVRNGTPYEERPIDDLSEYSDKLWKLAYERGKAEAITNEDIKKAISEGFKLGYEMAKAEGGRE